MARKDDELFVEPFNIYHYIDTLSQNNTFYRDIFKYSNAEESIPLEKITYAWYFTTFAADLIRLEKIMHKKISKVLH